MPLTAFGKAIRRARFDTGHTQMSMAAQLGTSPSYLSAMENGAKVITTNWLQRIERFFAKQGLYDLNLPKLAAISNPSLPLDGLPTCQRMLVVELALYFFTEGEINEIGQFVEQIQIRRLVSMPASPAVHLSTIGNAPSAPTQQPVREASSRPVNHAQGDCASTIPISREVPVVKPVSVAIATQARTPRRDTSDPFVIRRPQDPKEVA